MFCLQDEFRNNGYTDLLAGYGLPEYKDSYPEYGFYIQDLFDAGQKPGELLSIFISAQRDDLFFLLDGDAMDIKALCDAWDRRIRTFVVMNGRSDSVKKLKYNIVQLIVYSGDMPDKSREGNLQMSRKIIIRGDTADKKQIILDDDEVIELPFHIIPADTFAPDEVKVRKLTGLLPENKELLSMLKQETEKKSKKKKDGVLPKTFSEQDFEKIKGWLEK